MEILLRQVRIIDPSSPFNQKTADLFIKNGIIESIGADLSAQGKEVKIEGLCISPGWTDIFSNFCDPGFEYKETLETGAIAAAHGGYTDVMVLPNTAPVLHSKSSIEYVMQKGKTTAVNIHPIAAVTKNTEGKELAEMYDMHASGAVAFSDGTCTIQSAGLLLKALLYVKAIGKTIIQLPEDKTVSASGLMNEGVVSTGLGLPGKPAISEEIMIQRDIELAEYTGSSLHITGVSSARGIQLIRTAKDKGIQVTCSVTPYHLLFCDEDLKTYDTNLEVNPPLRTSQDRKALQDALINGTVDCIATHHLPQDTDHKVIEFEYAQYGMLGLETSFSLLRTAMPDLTLERIVEVLSILPRRIFGLPRPSIREREAASLTLFLPDSEQHYVTLHSRSRNSPFIGQSLKGKVAGIINKDNLFLTA